MGVGSLSDYEVSQGMTHASRRVVKMKGESGMPDKSRGRIGYNLQGTMMKENVGRGIS